MKNISLLTVLLLFAIVSLPDYHITRGTAIGEIYFIGPTHTGLALYRSTDFGQSLFCMDSIAANDMISVEADKTTGAIYYVNIQQTLFKSENYGIEGSWNIINNNISTDIISGRVEGEIYSSFSKHSEDYGNSFIPHSGNGYFGNNRSANIDFQTNEIGYVLVDELFIFDSLYLLITNDNFENLEQINVFNILQNEIVQIESGNQSGEVFLFNKSDGNILFSDNYGYNFGLIDYLNINDFYSIGFIKGNQVGEVFILYNFVNSMWQNAHIYIYHSTNYGKTFDVYHPFAKGNEPVLSNFSTLTKEVFLFEEVEFDNYSIGNISEYQWDFENDGSIDSYNEFPVYIYQDTGWYSVRLSVVGADSTNSFVKHNYIHIIDTTTFIKENNNTNITISPNPFYNELYINFNNANANHKISVYNLQGIRVKEKFVNQDETSEINLSNIRSGVYILNIKNQDQSTNYKIIKN